jgi:hypothetical protein
MDSYQGSYPGSLRGVRAEDDTESPCRRRSSDVQPSPHSAGRPNLSARDQPWVLGHDSESAPGLLASQSESSRLHIDGDQGRLQQQLQSLFPLLNANLRETCTSNLVFVSTSTAAGVSDAQAQAACWRVHQEIIRIVQPTLMLVFGIRNPSPYDFITKNYLSPSGKRLRTESREPIGHGDYCAEAMTAQIDGRSHLVIGLPHPGRFSFKRMREVADRINRLALEHAAVS